MCKPARARSNVLHWWVGTEKRMLRSKTVGVSILGNVEEVIALQRRRGIPMYSIPRKRGFIFGGNPAKDKPHGLPLCWVACGGVLWCPRMVPIKTGLSSIILLWFGSYPSLPLLKPTSRTHPFAMIFLPSLRSLFLFASQVRGMKTRLSVKCLCDACKPLRRKNRVYITWYVGSICSFSSRRHCQVWVMSRNGLAVRALH